MTDVGEHKKERRFKQVEHVTEEIIKAAGPYI
jgi:hypothetical protein